MGLVEGIEDGIEYLHDTGHVEDRDNQRHFRDKEMPSNFVLRPNSYCGDIQLVDWYC